MSTRGHTGKAIRVGSERCLEMSLIGVGRCLGVEPWPPGAVVPDEDRVSAYERNLASVPTSLHRRTHPLGRLGSPPHRWRRSQLDLGNDGVVIGGLDPIDGLDADQLA